MVSSAEDSVINANLSCERLMFNAGDSCQLCCGSMKMKLKYVKYIFLSSLAPHNTSGLPGLIHSLSDLVSNQPCCLFIIVVSSYVYCCLSLQLTYVQMTQGIESLTIVGPPGIDAFIEALRPFTNRQYPILKIVSIGNDKLLEDASRCCHRKEVITSFFTVVVTPIYVSIIPLH